MLRVEASIIIRAPWTRVAELYRDYKAWPRLFPDTIRDIHLLASDGRRTELEIDHREGKVPNVMTEVNPHRVDLWEAKRRYEATFVNSFEGVPGGTCYAVSAEIKLKGLAQILEPLLRPYIRRQLIRYVLMPLRVAAEDAASGAIPVT